VSVAYHSICSFGSCVFDLVVYFLLLLSSVQFVSMPCFARFQLCFVTAAELLCENISIYSSVFYRDAVFLAQKEIYERNLEILLHRNLRVS